MSTSAIEFFGGAISDEESENSKTKKRKKIKKDRVREIGKLPVTYTPKTAAPILGFKTEHGVYKLIDKGKLKCRRDGVKIIIHDYHILEYWESLDG